MRKVLIVDDEEHARQAFKYALQGEYSIQLASDGGEALDLIKNEPFDVVLLDLLMRDVKIDGMQALQRLNQERYRCAVIVITGHASVDTAAEAINLGAYDYIQKPIDNNELRLAVKRAIEVQELKEALNQALTECAQIFSYDSIIACGPKMQKVLSLAQRAALYHSSTVLITGESGTGKELIARVIHQNSIRGTKPFVEVDVGAVPETLVEDFFFGHEEGAFTDAKRTRIGVIEEAHGGTLFLDEIGNMDIRLQPKLLRALQERKIKRLGGRKEIEVDFRVIAATNIDLQQMVNEGVFREDLYYRLNTFPINIPPLRERPEDIGLLVWHFVQKVDKRQPGKRIRGVEQKFVEQLKNYDWPGNVRELEHIVERAVMLSNKDVLMGDLAKESMKNNISSRKTLERSDRIERIVEGMLKDEERPLKNVIQRWCDSIDKELIRQLFQAFGDKTGAIDKVAEQYGISRVALYDKLKKYGINWKTEAIGSGS